MASRAHALAKVKDKCRTWHMAQADSSARQQQILAIDLWHLAPKGLLYRWTISAAVTLLAPHLQDDFH